MGNINPFKYVILLVVGATLLNGCALYDAYTMTGYDSNEYLLITEIRTNANLSKEACNDATQSRLNAMAMSHKTTLFQNYEEQIPRNKNGANASVELNKIAQGLKARYNDGTAVPALFCKLKFESIEHSAQTIQHVIGKRPR
jgi:hypothetical protein